MTFHGVVDIRATQDVDETAQDLKSKNMNELYVTLFKLLNSATVASEGITRIAFSTGSSPVGNGQDYWDTANATGDNAWSVWKFASSSIPFYMLLQYSMSGTFGASPGNPGLADNLTSNNIAVAFALNADGSSPWNGTTRNDGTDVKNFQVWTSGSSQLFVWPRSNSFSGTHVVQKQNMMGLVVGGVSRPPVGSRAHFVLDRNNFAAAADDLGDGSYRVFYFGKYLPRSGTNIAVPYVCAGSDNETYDPAIQLGQQYGLTAGTGKTGGIAHPWIVVSGTRSCIFSGLKDFWTTTFQPNTVIPNPQFDEFPILCAINEAPWQAYVGQLDYNFIRFCFGVESLDCDPTFSRFAVGVNTYNTTKVTLPWNGVNMPGSGNSRTGTVF